MVNLCNNNCTYLSRLSRIKLAMCRACVGYVSLRVVLCRCVSLCVVVCDTITARYDRYTGGWAGSRLGPRLAMHTYLAW